MTQLLLPRRTEICPGIIRYHEPNNMNRITYKKTKENIAIQIDVPIKFKPIPISLFAILMGEKQRYIEVLDEIKFKEEEKKALILLTNKDTTKR